MDSKPFVSIRKWIKWGDEPSIENTSTLVLTSRAKHFVDVRIILSHDGTLPTDPLDTTSLQHLEWAFAGTAKSTAFPKLDVNPEPSTTISITEIGIDDNPTSHTVWTHWVDSKVALGTEVSDEGDMYPVPGSTEVLEKGVMQNPATERLQAYQELWVDLDVDSVDGEEGYVSWVCRTGGGNEGRVDGDGEAEVRGVVVRIGGRIQGVLKKGEKVSVRRWEWRAGEEKNWVRTVAIGEMELVDLVERKGDIGVGEGFVGEDGVVWECVESYSWR